MTTAQAPTDLNATRFGARSPHSSLPCGVLCIHYYRFRRMPLQMREAFKKIKWCMYSLSRHRSMNLYSYASILEFGREAVSIAILDIKFLDHTLFYICNTVCHLFARISIAMSMYKRACT